MAVIEVRDVVNYVHVREVKPGNWVDTGVSARTPAPGVKKTVLAVRRTDGRMQKWAFVSGATYVLAGAGLLISGQIDGPPAV